MHTLSFILVSIVLSAQAGAAPKKGANLERGQKVFAANCVACHGEKGDGNGPAAKAISGAKPRNFIEGDFKYGSSKEELFKTVTNGVTGTAMPPWNGLPEDDRKAVIEFILSLKKNSKH